MIVRNPDHHHPGIADHDRPESLITIIRNPQSSMSDVFSQIHSQLQQQAPPGAGDVFAQIHSESQGQQQQSDTGVWAGVKRNTVGMIAGLYHAFTDPATDQEKQDLLAKVRKQNAQGDDIPEDLATSPSRATLAYHRLIDAPADYLEVKGSNERAAARDLMRRNDTLKGANLYLSGLTDTALSAVPLAGPAINSIAERFERGDHSGAATDLAAALTMENLGKRGEAPEVTTASRLNEQIAHAADGCGTRWCSGRNSYRIPSRIEPVCGLLTVFRAEEL